MVVTALIQPLAVAGLLLCLIVAGRMGQRSLPLGRVRSLLPSWRFFHDTADEFSLWVRVGRSPGAQGPWQPALPPKSGGRHWWLISPETNLRLADYRWLQLVGENLETQANQILDSHAYAALRQLAGTTASQVRDRCAQGYQFQLRIHRPGHDDQCDAIMLQSEFVPFEGEHA